MTLRIYEDLEQGSPEWFAARCGIPTASVIGQLITKGSPDALAVDCPRCLALTGEPCISTARKAPTPIKTIHDERTTEASTLPPIYKTATGDTARALILNLAAERITGYVEPTYTSADMERGNLSEPYARDVYSQNYAPATTLGFMVRDLGGYQLGYSPDGLVGDDGLIEIKAPRQKKHLATILADEVPAEHMAQCQTGLFVSGRDWIDFISYNGGMPLFVKRVLPDPQWQTAILEAVTHLEETTAQILAAYHANIGGRPATERIDFYLDMEIF